MVKRISLFNHKGGVSKTTTAFRLVVDRRNKIAHEADVDPTYPHSRWPISQTDVDGTLSFLSETVEAIYGAIK